MSLWPSVTKHLIRETSLSAESEGGQDGEMEQYCSCSESVGYSVCVCVCVGGGLCLDQLCTNTANDCHLASEHISLFLLFFPCHQGIVPAQPVCHFFFKADHYLKLKTQLE